MQRVRYLIHRLECFDVNPNQAVGVEARDRYRQESQVRWRRTLPNLSLTWSRALEGDAFIAKVSQYGGFRSAPRILEVGPGYGRLLTTILKQGVAYRTYLGVDLSAANVDYLRRTFGNERTKFVQGDINTLGLGDKFDLVLSSLTFKHLFPSFEDGLRNIAKHLSIGSLLIFDLREGSDSYFEPDRITFIRTYSRPEVVRILEKLGLHLVAFDNVRHARGFSRLLVVAATNP